MTTTAPRKTPAKAATTVVPASAKKPSDRKPKAETAPEPDAPVVDRHEDRVELTYRGITVTITQDAANDYEVLEDAASGDSTRLPGMLRKLVGDEGHNAIKEACRDSTTGRVRLEGDGSISEFVAELFGALNPN